MLDGLHSIILSEKAVENLKKKDISGFISTLKSFRKLVSK